MMPATSSCPRRRSSMRCGTIRRALCANKDQTADCTWSKKHRVHGLVAQKRRAGVLATAGARAWPTLHARGRAVCRATPKLCMTRTTRTCPNIRDLILKCTKTHERAQLGLGTQICVIILAILGLGTRTREVRERIVIKQSNAAQKSNNQIPLWIPLSHPTPKLNQNNQNPGRIPGNMPHCLL